MSSRLNIAELNMTIKISRKSTGSNSTFIKYRFILIINKYKYVGYMSVQKLVQAEVSCYHGNATCSSYDFTNPGSHQAFILK